VASVERDLRLLEFAGLGRFLRGDGDAGIEVTATYEVSNEAVAILLVRLVRLNLVERMLRCHADLVLDQHFNLVCQSAAPKLYSSQLLSVHAMSSL
jgi:hypothetical protein